jgi:hypothetical protein
VIAARALDEWLRPLPPEAADRALLAAGLRWDDLVAANDETRAGRPAPVTRWTLGDEEFAALRRIDPSGLADLLPQTGGLRLAVTTDAAALDVARRLGRTAGVTSAFVAVERPASALRRRPWHWPLRVGLVGFPPGAAEAIMTAMRAGHHTVPNLLELARVEDQPGAVDVAVIEGPLLPAVGRLVEHSLVANALLVLDEPAARPAVVEALLATARAATGASASALLTTPDLTDLIRRLVEELSHANPFDVALARAAGPELMLWAEPEAMARAALPLVPQRLAREVAQARAAAPEASGALEAAALELQVAAEAPFDLERRAASGIARGTAALEPQLDALAEPRWCQIKAGPLRRGGNDVAFFIGALEAGARSAPAPLDESQLPWDADVTAFQLTVLFIPAVADAVAQQAELELPRFGRTEDVRFTLDVDGDAAEARILVLFRNRILQAALLTGGVGEVPELREAVALVPALSGLDERRPFDLALFANHAGGRAMLTAHANGTTIVTSAGSVPAAGTRLAKVLGSAAIDRRSLKAGIESPAARTWLIELAVKGRALYKGLRDEFGSRIPASPRIQVVAARSSWLLPIELVYEREAPVETARICPNYVADPSTCTGRCPAPRERDIVCPNAFWGLSKTIERYRYDADRDPVLFDGYQVVGAKRPRRGRGDLRVRRALFGASDRVTPRDSAATVAAIGHGAVAVPDWDAWEAALEQADTELLVLLPHTDNTSGTIEIAAKTLDLGMIEPRHVTGGRDVDPIMILFGCATAGNAGDPEGFATAFFREGACAVFHSFADLRNAHATELARRLTACLLGPDRPPRLLSDALVQFRREAVADGYVAALGIGALGDADWRI